MKNRSDAAASKIVMEVAKGSGLAFDWREEVGLWPGFETACAVILDPPSTS